MEDSDFIVLTIRQGGITHDRIKFLSLQVVKNGLLENSFQWDIQPPDDETSNFTNFSYSTLKELWSEIKEVYDECDYVVADSLGTHKSNFEYSLKYYGIEPPVKKYIDISAWERQAELNNLGLSKIERVLALERYTGKSLADRYKYLQLNKHLDIKHFFNKSTANLDGIEALNDISEENIKGKTIVISGEFELFPDRNDLANILVNMGARVVSSISGKTDVLLAGKGVGASKVEKVRTLLNSGKQINLILEESFNHFITEIKNQ